MMSSYRIPPKAILYIWSHSVSARLGKGEVEDEESNKKWHKKEGFSWNFVMGCFYINVSKNSIVSDVIFYLPWYKVIHWSSHICKKSYFHLCHSFLVKFSKQHRGSDRTKLTEPERDKKGHYASGVAFEWPHV